MSSGSYGPAVADGVLLYTSPSAIEKFDADGTEGGCERKGWYRYVLRLPDKTTKAQALGVDVHGQIEHYTLTAEDVLGSIAAAGRHLILPPRRKVGDDLLVEHQLQDFRAAGVRVVGKIDQLNGSGEYLDEEGAPRPLAGAVEVVDFKTSRDLARYAKGPVELARSVQMLTYGRYALEKLPEATGARLSHVGFQTEGRPRAQKRSTLLSRGEVADRWARVEGVVERIKLVVKATRAEDVRPNFGACAAYGGCAYESVCPKSAAWIGRKLLGYHSKLAAEEDAMGILSGLGKRADAPAQTTSTAPAAPAPAVQAAPPSADAARLAELQAAKARLLAEEEALKAKAAAQAPADQIIMLKGDDAQRYAKAAGMDPIPPGAGIQTTLSGARLAGIIPPDAPAPGTTGPAAESIPPEQLAAMPPAIQAAHAQVVEGTMGAMQPAAAMQAALAAGQAIAPSAPETTPAKKRGRKPRAVAATAHPEGADTTPAEGFALYVNCPILEGFDAEPLEDYALPLVRAIEEESKVGDLRTAPNESVLAFGKWRGVLDYVVRTHPPKSGAYYVCAPGEVLQVVVDALWPLAAVRVRGGSL